MVLRLAAVAILGFLWISPSSGEPGRTLVGHVMALLAVFEEAEVLPQEATPEANALIHALIQTQAALTKSTNPAVRRWFADALHKNNSGDHPLSAADGLSSRALEAILAHAASHPPVDRPEVLAGLMEYNVRPADLDLLARVYEQASERFRSTGRDIHRAYESQRRAMPFR